MQQWESKLLIIEWYQDLYINNQIKCNYIVSMHVYLFKISHGFKFWRIWYIHLKKVRLPNLIDERIEYVHLKKMKQWKSKRVQLHDAMQ